MLLTAALLAMPHAYAQDCRSLEKEIDAASPAGVDEAFSALAECDAERAKNKAEAAFERVLSGEDGEALALKAVEVGANDATRTWIAGLQSDERSRAIAKLGGACSESATVASFLVESESTLGESFWDDRWYRSLSECREPAIQQLLSDKLDDPENGQTLFFGVLEVYSRNLAGDAIARLESLAADAGDEEQTYIVNAFADAAQVGSVDGMDADVAKAAVDALNRIAPDLAPLVVEQARNTMLSLGDQAASDALSGVRYDASRWDDGRLHYGLVVLEVTTCKKGDVWLGVHTGEISEAGAMWPDQILDPTTAAVEKGWEFKQAKKCKGTTELEVILPEEPHGEAEDIEGWVNAQLEAAAEREAAKRSEAAQPALSL